MIFSELNGNMTATALHANDDRTEPRSGIKLLVRYKRIHRLSHKAQTGMNNKPCDKLHYYCSYIDTEELT
jgi:hypothetical protein